MSKISHYFKRRKALKLFADRFLFEPLRPLAPQPGQVVTPPAQPVTQFKPEVPQPMQPPQQPPPQPVQVAPVAPPQAPVQPTQIPVSAPTAPGAVVQPTTNTRDEIVQTLRPMNDAARDVINRRLT